MPITKRQSPLQKTWAFTANDYETARQARREFSLYMTSCGIPKDAVQEATLIFGELIGNAVRHVGGDVRAYVTFRGKQPVLCVSDTARDADLEIPDRGPESESGRGLKIVHALARKVWVERDSTVKTICAVLPCEGASKATQ